MPWVNLKNAINAVIKTNDNQEITGLIMQNVLNTMINSLGANATFAGVATPTTSPGTPDGPVFYITGTHGQYSNFNNVSFNSGELAIFLWNGTEWSFEVINLDTISKEEFKKVPIIEDDEEDIFCISDEKNFKILRIGIDYFKIGNSFFLSLQRANEGNILKCINGIWVPTSDISSINDLINYIPNENEILKYVNGEWKPVSFNLEISNSNTFSIEDEKGIAALKIAGNAFQIGKYIFDLPDLKEGQTFVVKDGKLISGNGNWAGKVMATYGDSVVAINNGDFTRPYKIDNNTSWGVYAANYFGASKFYGRGIGGQSYKWGTGGGSVSWLSPDGNYIARLDDYNYDSWGNLSTKVYPSGVTADMISSGTAITVRGCGCSWLRIIKSFPASIKNNIDVVSVLFHNDAANSYPDYEWVENSAVDPEWAASDQYSDYGGDYNIETTTGAIASTIMKLHAWMPNARLVLCTPISGRGISGELNMGLLDNDMHGLAAIVSEMGSLLATPVVDLFSNDGINGFNRTDYISDTIHPYTTNGKKAVANAFISGMQNINQVYK